MKTFNEYQKFTQSIAVYPEDATLPFNVLDGESMPLHWLYPVLGLAEEAGEVAGKVAKAVRKYQTQGHDYEDLKESVKKELGDTLYMLSETARQFGLTLEEVATGNYDKLKDRVQRGVLVGEGDNR